MSKRKQHVICAMSGGVDSSVSAAILAQKGYRVTGVFMKCWDSEPCTNKEDEMWARRAAAKIGVPLYSIDFTQEYGRQVLEYFIREHKAGNTPNPDVMCNREIKFGVFYDWAINKFGANYIATGHYARLRRKSQSSRLLKGSDPNKDQSYFLWAVPREKFERVIFPVGKHLKTEVRALAKKFGLPNADRKDSQGICFIGKLPLDVFIRKYIQDRPGPIINTKRERIGTHKGLHFYTIGQRQRIGIAARSPYYVARKNYTQNALIVTPKESDDLYQKTAVVSDVNWLSKPHSFPAHCKAKLRYRQDDQDAIIEERDNGGNLIVEFPIPQRAVTPGQSIVFYKNDELLGGGIIRE